MSLEELKDLMLKVSMGRRDAAEQIAEFLFEIDFALHRHEEIVNPVAPTKPKKAAK